MQQPTKKKWDEDAIVVSPGGGGTTAHLVALAPRL
jgi:1-aminocyclopropane-1-carboxylate deaminase/D-cysteine desulfhydrase-like pyridoxal-dependent ACC family enzyme